MLVWRPSVQSVRLNCPLAEVVQPVHRRVRMGLLETRVALITGASRGIGRALSERFAREGAAVVCASRTGDQLKETAGAITAAGGRAIAVVCDASIEDDVRRTVAQAVNEFGKLDTLVNN